MTTRKIYLAGNISSDPETYKWREEATKLLKDKYTILNPAANKFNKTLIKDHKGDAGGFLEEAIGKSQAILITKDFALVNSADIILVNLQIVTPEKPLIGTLFELSWAWLLRKPIIAIMGNNIYSKHPFVTCAISAKVNSVEEAAEVIKEFFQE